MIAEPRPAQRPAQRRETVRLRDHAGRGRRRQSEHDRNRQGGPERDRRRPANPLGRGRAIGQQTGDTEPERLDDGISRQAPAIDPASTNTP